MRARPGSTRPLEAEVKKAAANVARVADQRFLTAPSANDSSLLYCGDNLEILRSQIPNESIDLVYLDPPFSSNRAYNIIFRDESGRVSDTQQMAFDDTRHWGPTAEDHYSYLTTSRRHGGRVSDGIGMILDAIREAIGENPMMAYIVEMTVRLIELKRVLKKSGSLYLHCDPTASHYLRIHSRRDFWHRGVCQ